MVSRRMEVVVVAVVMAMVAVVIVVMVVAVVMVVKVLVTVVYVVKAIVLGEVQVREQKLPSLEGLFALLERGRKL